MARQRTSPFEDFIAVASRLPWWVCMLLVIVSYLVLHMIASRPAVTVAGPGQMGEAAQRAMLTTLAMFGQYILPFAFGIAALTSGINSTRRKKLYHRVESRSDVAALSEISWQDFEGLVAEYYRRNGFVVDQAGGNGPDDGIDLVLRKNKGQYLVQCKQWKAYRVGVQPVREFYGVMAARGADGGYFVTSGTYTEDAQEFARGLNIDLIDGQRLRRMIGTTRARTASGVDIEPLQAAVACPKCGAPMKKRVARRGDHVGKEFWGCIGFPKCTGTRPL